MGVVVDLFGELVVDDEGEAFYIDPASGDIGGDEKLGAFFFKGAHDFIAFELGEFALEGVNGVSSVAEFFREDVCAVSGAGEDESASGALAMEEFVDEVGLVFFRADGEAVIDIAVDDVSGVDDDGFRVRRHADSDEVLKGAGEGGGEEPGGFAGFGEVDGGADLVFKAHAEHFVGFV